MIDSLLDRATSILERCFPRNAFLPVPVFSHNDTLAVSEEQSVIGYFTFCWFGAVVVAGQWRNIIRLFGGYPLQRLPRLKDKGGLSVDAGPVGRAG
ncbi:hypothetical protein [Nonomuraea endophytica]|uniref:Uncharacterized protein n=1 Tax=Nonomuraea endophytica TaxID=714136 RepID=A0A7W7ZYP8_9ACTN|nr:hypothetical protein [Nonomuraea endophytica]MBB5076290.1 hypothetical protein [Nonomuraea endophytica]